MRRYRTLKKGAKYLIYSRVNKKNNLLKPHDVKNLFLKTIKRAKKKYRFSIKNFVVMDSYFIFIIEPLGEESLSRIMQWILSVFAMNYNIKYNEEDHFWRARFWSKIIDDIKQYLENFEKVSKEAVKEQKVKEAKNYRFGGLYFILKGIFEIVDKPDFDINF